MNYLVKEIAQSLEMRFEQSKFSWAGLARKLDLKEHSIMDARRRPIPGTIYDPEANNYDAVATVICKDEEALNLFRQLTKEDFAELASTARGGGGVKKYLPMEKIQTGHTYYLWYAPQGQIQVTVIAMTDTHIAAQNTQTSQLYAWRHTSFVDYAPNLQEASPEELTRKSRVLS